MTNVFISYSHLDSPVAQAIGSGLQQIGIDVFTDDTVITDDAKNVADKQVQKRVEKALGKSDVTVILLSKNSKRSNWVEEKISHNISNKENVIPILLDEGAKDNWVWPLVGNREAIDFKSEPIEAVIRKVALATESIRSSRAQNTKSIKEVQEIKEKEAKEIKGRPGARFFDTNIPARLDHLPWSRFHTRVCVALGLTWILAGLAVTLVSPLDPVIRPTLHLSEDSLDTAVLTYLIGLTLGALTFSWATDRFGRSRLIILTVLILLLGTAATGLAWDNRSFAAFRFVTGAGMGGAYVAVNSALQELIPAHYRGTTIISVNGFFWVGAMLGALVSLVVPDPKLPYPEANWEAAFSSWRVIFVAASILALVTVPLLRWIPESPRWLIARGQPSGSDKAERIVASIETEVGREYNVRLLPQRVFQPFQFDHTTIGGAAQTMLRNCINMFDSYRSRTALGLAMMANQAFLYNGIFFDCGRQLNEIYHVQSGDIGRYMLPIAFNNLVGALVLGRLFDSVGRKSMIIITYALSGILLAFTGSLFWLGALENDAWGYTACWMTIFFFASAAASSAYLTVGEAFPVEMRAMSIALLFSFGTMIGGVLIPLLFKLLVPAEALNTFYYFLTALLMVATAGTAWLVDFEAARKPVEVAGGTVLSTVAAAG